MISGGAKGVGVNQAWQTVTRTSGVTYYNTTGRVIELTAYVRSATNGQLLTKISIDGGADMVLCGGHQSLSAAAFDWGGSSVLIPPNASYMLTDSGAAFGTRYTQELK